MRDDDKAIDNHGLRSLADTGERAEADCMLPIGYLGHSMKQIVASGVPITSGIWLLPFYDLPKVGGDFFATEITFDLAGTLHPGEVRSRPRLSKCYTSRVETLIERVPDIVQGLGGLASDGARQSSVCLDLEAMVLGLVVRLYDDAHSVREEVLTQTVKFVDGFCCPLESFFRAIERCESNYHPS